MTTIEEDMMSIEDAHMIEETTEVVDTLLIDIETEAGTTGITEADQTNGTTTGEDMTIEAEAMRGNLVPLASRETDLRPMAQDEVPHLTRTREQIHKTYKWNLMSV